MEIELYSGDRDDFALHAKIGGENDTAVVGVDTSANEITLEQDRTSLANAGHVIRLVDHPDEGRYEVSSISYDSNADETTIGTVESLSDSTVEGYVLFPWDVKSDFQSVKAQMRITDRFKAAAEWSTADGSLELNDGDGTGDEMLFRVPPSLTADLREGPYQFDVEGEDANGEELTIIKRGEVEIKIPQDITQ